MEEKTIQKRHIAYKVSVKDLLEGKYIKNEGWQPNYIILSNSLKVSRANIIGVVISVNDDYKSFIIDDGTGKISMRTFENTPSPDNIEIGNILLVVGKPREYDSETYLIPEIIKRLDDPEWLRLRKMELKEHEKYFAEDKNITEDELGEKLEKCPEDIAQKICCAIKQFDKGNGADFDDILEQVNNKDTDKIIDRLIKQGEIFELRAGKLMLLNTRINT